MGFTKKQRREQKKFHSQQKFYSKKTLKRQGGSRQPDTSQVISEHQANESPRVARQPDTNQVISERRVDENLHAESPSNSGSSQKRQVGTFAAIKTTWIAPDGETRADYELVTAPGSTDLDQLQQQFQSKTEKQAKDTHPGWKVTVEVFDADHLPAGTLSEATTFRFSAKNNF